MRGELGVGAIGERVALRLVVAVDLGLDRDGARHRRRRAEQRGADAERIAGDVPQRMQDGRADAALDDQVVEHREVPRLLRLHPPDRRGDGGAVAHHRELSGVDPRGAIFAGVVDADHLVDGFCLAIEPQCHASDQGRDQGVIPRHRHAEQRPCCHIAADQRRGEHGGNEAAAGGERRRGARLRPRPPVVFDPGVERADAAGDEDADGGDGDEDPVVAPRPRQQPDDERGDVRPALPQAHLARREVAEILEGERAAEQRRAADEDEGVGGFRGHSDRPDRRRRARRRRARRGGSAPRYNVRRPRRTASAAPRRA